MVRKSLFRLVLAIALLGLVSCAKTTGGNDEALEGQVTLYLFGAPWCSNCHRDIPKLSDLLAQETNQVRSRVNTVMYVTSAETQFVPPTQEVADQYKADLGVNFESRPDPWHWTKFTELLGEGTPFALPAAVIVDEAGHKKVYKPGDFYPSVVVGFLRDNLR